MAIAKGGILEGRIRLSAEIAEAQLRAASEIVNRLYPVLPEGEEPILTAAVLQAMAVNFQTRSTGK